MIKNRTIFTGDNLPILRGMADESVDLIYLDPPFNSNRNYEAPIGSAAAGASFKDAWTFEDTDAAWWGEIAEEHPEIYTVIDTVGKVGGKGAQAYSIYMAVRLLEMYRVLKDTGSIYLHCDPTMSHSLKLVMDGIFGRTNFRNEIVWSYRTGGASKRQFSKKHDVLFFYSKSESYVFNLQREKNYTRSRARQPGMINYGAGSSEFFQDEEGVYNLTHMRDVWDIPYINSQAKERTGYPTQKPLALLRRVVKASSNKGDVLLDPFCGCATACVAAEDEGREWIGIDVSELAFSIVQERLHKSREEGGIGSLFARDVSNRKDIPKDKNVVRSKNIKHVLYGEQEGKCNGCLVHFAFRNLEVDHIVPLSEGGSEDDGNKQLLCGACNRKKGARDMKYLIAHLREEGLR